ncbi:MAG: AzlC family ABC transporter permease [Pseudomonadota bacterium]
MLPLVPALVMFGLAIGVLAASNGFSLLEAVLMSGLVFAGASQVAALEAWMNPPVAVALAAIVAAVNSRYFLAGATLSPILKGSGFATTFTGLFLTTDPNWATVMQREGAAEERRNFLIRSGVFILVIWLVTTACGYFLGEQITDLNAVGIDLLVMVYFALILVPAWKTRWSKAASWVAAIGVSLTIWHTFGGHTHIVVGALVSALIAAFWHSDEEPSDDA